MSPIERAERIAAAPMDAAQEIEELHAKLRDADFRERGLHEALRRETANTRGAVEERDRLREVLRAVLMEPDPIKRNQLAAPVLTTTGGGS